MRARLPTWSSPTACPWSGRFGRCGDRCPERVAGVDLMTSLLEAGSTERLRVYLLGARQEVLDALSRNAGGAIRAW